MCSVGTLLDDYSAVTVTSRLARPPARPARGVAVVAVATVLAYGTWFDGDAGSPNLFRGAVTMAAAAVLVGAGKLWERRRVTTTAD